MTDRSPDLRHLAELGKLQLPEPDLRAREQDIAAILSFISTLQSVDTSNASPTNHVTELENIFRQDDVVPSVHHRTLLEHAPRRRGDLFQSPAVFQPEL